MRKPVSKRALKKAMRVLHDEIFAMDDSLYSDLRAMGDRLRDSLYSAMKLLRDELRYDLKIMEARIVSDVRIATLSRVPYRGEADVLSTNLHTK